MTPVELYEVIVTQIYNPDLRTVIDNEKFSVVEGEESDLPSNFAIVTEAVFESCFSEIILEHGVHELYVVNLSGNFDPDRGIVIYELFKEVEPFDQFSVESNFEAIQSIEQHPMVTYFCVFDADLRVVFFSFNEEWCCLKRRF